MTALPTDRTAASTIAEHVDDHNILHALNNDLDDHLVAADPHPGYATDADVTNAVAALVDAAPGALDTLNELAAALGDDANFATTVTTSLAGKAAAVHAHAEADVTSLVSDLAGKAATNHTHSGTSVSFTPTGTIAATNVQDAIAEVAAEAGGGVPGDYGDGSDGVVNFDGTTTRLGMAPSSGVYTLTRDIFLAGGSQVSGTAVVKTANYRIYCAGTFTVGSTAVVHNDGNAASSTAGGAATAIGTMGATAAGGSGVANTAGNLGANPSNPLGAAGGAGGLATGAGSPGGGNAGGTPAPAAAVGLPRTTTRAITTQWGGGGSGAGGNAVAGSTGGGGGAGGGVLGILAYDLVINGTIRAAGGAGAAGTGTTAGGGGGGGGGAVSVVYRTKSGTGSTLTAAANAPGGAGGAATGATRAGAAGSNGTIYEIVN